MIPWRDYQPADPEGVEWDAVIVGAGMGGGFLGWSLARQGLKVLFLERGDPVNPLAGRPRLGRLRRLLSPASLEADLAAAGRWNRRVTLIQGGRRRSFHLPMGNGPGGSSALYGATLERFRREDFDGVEGQGVEPPPLPGRWPIPYEAFLPYYREAERLLGVRGGRDPTDPDDDSALLAPPPMSDRDQRFFDAFAAAGLAPHRMHMAIAYKPGCVECLGRLCPRDCKADASNRAVWPALRDHRAKLLAGFAASRIGATGDRIDHVVGRWNGRELRIRGKIVVLAAGALSTPLLLLNSVTDRWPAGIGNEAGLVGRGLMFHALQIFALWPPGDASGVGPAKTLSSRVMNQIDGVKVGGLQSFAQNVAPGQIAEFVVGAVERRLPFRPPLLPLVARAAAVVGARLFRRAALFATLTEDFAYPGNRVAPDPAAPSGFCIFYTGTRDLAARCARMRAFLGERLAAMRLVWLTQDDLLNFGHPAGTCRFGDSPATSVLDPGNRVHGARNLYVVDASFFPSSAATNPSLTIAANALRVADLIARDFAANAAEPASPILAEVTAS
jgi:choline dehydrogenase-like flavoprotein